MSTRQLSEVEKTAIAHHHMMRGIEHVEDLTLEWIRIKLKVSNLTRSRRDKVETLVDFNRKQDPKYDAYMNIIEENLKKTINEQGGSIEDILGATQPDTDSRSEE